MQLVEASAVVRTASAANDQLDQFRVPSRTLLALARDDNSRFQAAENGPEEIEAVT